MHVWSWLVPESGTPRKRYTLQLHPPSAVRVETTGAHALPSTRWQCLFTSRQLPSRTCACAVRAVRIPNGNRERGFRPAQPRATLLVSHQYPHIQPSCSPILQSATVSSGALHLMHRPARTSARTPPHATPPHATPHALTLIRSCLQSPVSWGHTTAFYHSFLPPTAMHFRPFTTTSVTRPLVTFEQCA